MLTSDSILQVILYYIIHSNWYGEWFIAKNSISCFAATAARLIFICKGLVSFMEFRSCATFMLVCG